MLKLIDDADLIRALLRYSFQAQLSSQQARYLIEKLGKKFEFDANEYRVMELAQIEIVDNPTGFVEPKED